jgi:hypothetical protein
MTTSIRLLLSRTVLADVVQDDAEERSRDELSNLGNEVLNNKGIVLSMAQSLKGTNDPDIAVRVQKALDEANEAAGNS